MTFLLDLTLLLVSWTHVYLAPYSKVEESFNLHATHDVLMYGVGATKLHSYDHFTFPGAVPRTFIGSVLLAWIAQPVLRMSSFMGLLSSKFDVQMVVRLTLATLNSVGLSLLCRSVQRRFGRATAQLFVLLSITQFHLPFWMGRTLPNMFALFPVNVAHALLIDRGPNALRPTARSVEQAIALLTLSAAVFRAELLLLLAPLVLQSLVCSYTSFTRLVRIGLLSGLFSVALTVGVDSYFWNKLQKPIWPELYGLYFNVYQGKSADWGTSPTHAYLITHLPKLLLCSAPLAILGLALDRRVRSFVFPSALFIVGLSALAHKEWRFVVYAVPVLNVAAARGARALLGLRRTTGFGGLAPLALGGMLALNLLATYFFSRASVGNYPGGDALAQFNAHYAHLPHVNVHISNLAAQTGASLFLQTHAPPYTTLLPLPKAQATNWTYDKTEGLAPAELSLSKRGYTHLIVEADDPALKPLARSGWETKWVVNGQRWMVDWARVKGVARAVQGGRVREVLKGVREAVVGDVVRMVEEERLVVLERS